MVLSIKNEETERLARELAALNGETVSMAVTIALKERLERQQEVARPQSRSEVLAEFSAYCAPFFKDGPSGNELINALYDEETGLPK